MSRPFKMQVRVRLDETDALGVVYYGQYFTYFDISRLEMLRRGGVTAQLLMRRKLGFVAGEAVCRYLSSARFDDLLTLNVRVSKIGNSSVSYAHRITRGGKAVAEGRVTDIMVGPDGAATKIPPQIRSRLSRLE